MANPYEGTVWEKEERQRQTNKAVAAERERCAKIADRFPMSLMDHVERAAAVPTARQIAAAIRNKE